MKAILVRDGKASLAEIPIPEIGDGEVLLALEACGLCGTDVMKIDTRAPGAILGHELVGTVAKAGRGAPFIEGERLVVSHHVPCLTCHYCRRGQESMCRQFKSTNIEPGGFSEFIRIPALHVQNTSFKIPSGVDNIAASQTEPLACVMRNIKRLGVLAGDAVGIVGLGAIGQMTGQLLKIMGIAAFGLDLDPARTSRFARWGCAFTDRDAFGAVGKNASSGRGFDAIVYSAGTPALMARSLAWLRDGGTLNVFSSFHPDSMLALDLNAVYHRELSVISSYSPSLVELREAFDLIVSGKFNPLVLGPSNFPLESFPDAVQAVKTRRTLKSVLVTS